MRRCDLSSRISALRPLESLTTQRVQHIGIGMGIGSESAQAQTSARRPLCGQVRALAAQLHDKMHQLFSVVNNGVPTKVSWFRLFKHMDDDESGLISYTEFEGMVREELLLGPRQVPDKHLKAVWLCAAPLLATACRLGRSSGAPCTDSWFPTSPAGRSTTTGRVG